MKRYFYLSVIPESLIASQLSPVDFGNYYAVGSQKRVLGLDKADYDPPNFPQHHLYQELCPVTPRIVSELDPSAFSQSITHQGSPISVPTLVFCELELKKLARDPDSNDIGDLPYQNIGHLRDCLKELETRTDKPTKAVNRGMQADLLYRMVKSGFFVGRGDELLYFPMPSQEQLEREYYEWWRSAQNAFGE